MLIGIGSSPCSLSLRNRSTLCSTTKCHQNKSVLKNVLVRKSFFSISSILSIPIMLIGINGGYFPALCRVCFTFVHTAKLKKSNFLNDFYLALAAFARVRSCFYLYFTERKSVSSSAIPAICRLCSICQSRAILSMIFGLRFVMCAHTLL